MLQGDRRSDLQVAADMLRIRGSKTAIMYGANLSYTQTQKYLSLLVDIGLIEAVDGRNGRQQYGPTQRGHKFLALLERLEELMAISVPMPRLE